MEQNSEIELHIYTQRQITVQKIIFSTNDSTKIQNPYAYKRNISHYHTKISCKCIIDLKVKYIITKSLEENIKEHLHDMGLSSDFLNMAPKKKNKLINWTLLRLNIFVHEIHS